MTLDKARDKVESTVGEVAEKGSKLAGLDDMVVEAVEDTVEKVLHRLGVPTSTELKDLAGKVENLSAKVIAEFAKEHEAPKFKAAIVAGKVKARL